MHAPHHREVPYLSTENGWGVKELLFQHDQSLPPQSSQNNSMQIHLQPSYEDVFGKIRCVLIGHMVNWVRLCHIIHQEYNQKASEVAENYHSLTRQIESDLYLRFGG